MLQKNKVIKAAFFCSIICLAVLFLLNFCVRLCSSEGDSEAAVQEGALDETNLTHGQPESSVDAKEKFLSLNRLATEYESDGYFSEAVEVYSSMENGFEQLDYKLHSKLAIADCLEQAGLRREALNSWMSIVELDSLVPLEACAIARLNSELGRFQAADEYFQISDDLLLALEQSGEIEHPELPMIYLDKARHFSRSGRWAKALSNWRKIRDEGEDGYYAVPTFDSDSAWLDVEIATCLVALGKNVDAIELLRPVLFRTELTPVVAKGALVYGDIVRRSRIGLIPIEVSKSTSVDEFMGKVETVLELMDSENYDEMARMLTTASDFRASNGVGREFYKFLITQIIDRKLPMIARLRESLRGENPGGAALVLAALGDDTVIDYVSLAMESALPRSGVETHMRLMALLGTKGAYEMLYAYAERGDDVYGEIAAKLLRRYPEGWPTEGLLESFL